MMHYEDIVVTIVDSNKKPIRELDSEKINKGRKCKMFLPFGSEYQFLIKNNGPTRIKLDVEIDGSVVTENGIIVNSHTTEYLERFVNSNKKFKFVEKTHEAVADPSNTENGLIKVRVYKENYSLTCTPNFPRYFFQPYYGGSIVSPGIFSKDCDYSDYSSRSIGAVSNCSVNYMASVNNLNSGATVEGSVSNQHFGSTHWNGDNGVDTYFTFNLFGTTKQNDEKLQQYLKLKQELGL